MLQQRVATSGREEICSLVYVLWNACIAWLYGVTDDWPSGEVCCWPPSNTV